MTSVFRLPTLAVSSGFETPTVPAVLPHEVTSGSDPALAVVEGAHRPHGSVCRFSQPSGLIALRLADPVPAVIRVVLLLRSDRYADNRWSDRQRRQAKVRAVRGVDRETASTIADPQGRIRSVAVHAYGRLRAAVLMVNDGSEDGWVRQRVAFDVSGEELESGMLLLGLEPGPAVEDCLDDGLVGICLARIRVLASDGRGQGTVSTGLLADADGWLPYSALTGALVSPATTGPVRVDVRSPLLPEPKRGLLRGRTDLSLLEALALDGTPVPVEPGTPISAGSASFVVPGDRGPLRIRLLGPIGTEPGTEIRTGAPPD